MDEINKLKAECYDLMANIQQCQQLLGEKNAKIGELLEKQEPVEPVKK